jgi:hypothetical protein
MTTPAKLKRFKWLLLSEAAPETLSISYWWAKQLFPAISTTEIERLVRETVLALVDEGLLVLYWAKWSADTDEEHATVDRAAIENILRGDAPYDNADFAVWFRRTEAGQRRLDLLPADVLKEVYPPK